MQIVFVWWNTGLSPMGRRRATSEQIKTAFEVLDVLTGVVEVDCLALGEVIATDIADFRRQRDLTGYSFYDGVEKRGRLQFDTGVLYRMDTFHLEHAAALTVSRGSRSFKLANRLDFLILQSGDPLHVFVSHWPSRLWCEQHGAERHLLGVRLRDYVDEIFQLYERPPKIVLLGDFNDEPFDSSLSQQLLATRDRRLARKHPRLLYNPFWRLLGEAMPHVPGTPSRSYPGTCFYSGGVDSQWRTFDQIIFSSTFLGGDKWHLNEEKTRILQLELLRPSVSPSTNIFDHFPVISVIEREDTDG